MISNNQSFHFSTININFKQHPQYSLHSLTPYLFKHKNPSKTIIQKIQQNRLAKAQAHNIAECNEIILRKTKGTFTIQSNQSFIDRKKVKYHIQFDNLRTCLTENTIPKQNNRNQRQNTKKIQIKRQNYLENKQISNKSLKNRPSSSKSQINPYTNNQYKYIKNKQIDSVHLLRHSYSFKRHKNSITQSYKISPAPFIPKQNSIKFITSIPLQPRQRSEKNFPISPWSFNDD